MDLRNFFPLLLKIYKSLNQYVKYDIKSLIIIIKVLYNKQDEGVILEIDGEEVAMRGTLTVFSADNLAAWAIGGFKALSSAFRRCQYCMVIEAELQNKVHIY